MRVSLIPTEFKAISAQAFNVEAYLISINLELEKKTDQRATCLYSGPLYYTFTERQSTNSRRILIPLEILEKHNAKLFGNQIY